MIRIQLSPEELAYLEQTRRARRSQVAERCHYVLLNAAGYSVPQIAQRLERHEHTIRKWLCAYRAQGVMGLQNTPSPGRPLAYGDDLIEHLEPLLAHTPSDYGYPEAHWSVDLLRHQLHQSGLSVSDATVRRRLKAGGWVYKRLTQTLPHKAPSAEQKKKRVAQIVDTVQELRQAKRVEVLFADESHWRNEPYVQRGWCRKGQKRQVAGPAKRQRTTLFGALHLGTQKMYWKRAPRGTSKAFIAFLHQLHQCFSDALILLILDNAQIHRSRLVKRFVQQHDWIELEHLAPYSPEYNPIERFWKWLKAKVYGASSFDTIEDVVRKIRQMIWHYNERWLISTIYFKFEPYQNIL